MLAYDCKGCGKITVIGYINEFDKHFCSRKCYEKYCKKNNYEVHLEKLKSINDWLK